MTRIILIASAFLIPSGIAAVESKTIGTEECERIRSAFEAYAEMDEKVVQALYELERFKIDLAMKIAMSTTFPKNDLVEKIEKINDKLMNSMVEIHEVGPGIITWRELCIS